MSADEAQAPAPVNETANNDAPQKPDAETMILLNNSFVFSYVALLGVSLVTIIEALRATNPHVRHIMNLESSISLVAGIVYSVFVTLSNNPSTFDLSVITRVRYMDWTVTTPLLLLVLMLFFCSMNDQSIHLGVLLMVIVLDLVMLGFGYLGETGKISKISGWVFGTVAFFAMLLPIYFKFVANTVEQLVVFGLFTAIWFMYGVAYMLDEAKKNLMYNILDVTAKGLFGFFLWLYYAKIVVV
jgi:bacteriorhodopsin